MLQAAMVPLSAVPDHSPENSDGGGEEDEEEDLKDEEEEEGGVAVARRHDERDNRLVWSLLLCEGCNYAFCSLFLLFMFLWVCVFLTLTCSLFHSRTRSRRKDSEEVVEQNITLTDMQSMYIIVICVVCMHGVCMNTRTRMYVYTHYNPCVCVLNTYCVQGLSLT